MIVILFQAGTFGSTIEYCLSNFSNELDNVPWGLTDSGSMHGFNKQLHLYAINDIHRLRDNNATIATPVYPTVDGATAHESVETFIRNIDPEWPVIFLYCDTTEQHERNQLFAFHKLSSKEFFDIVLKDKAQSWNDLYQNWRDMKLYEIREALSFYVDHLSSTLGLEKIVPNNWFKATPDDILLNFEDKIKSMIKFCNLTCNELSIAEFGQLWRSKQQYVLDEFNQVARITEHIKQHTYFKWTKLSLMSEAIIQSRLRRLGIELACYGLNEFPTDTETLQRYYI